MSLAGSAPSDGRLPVLVHRVIARLNVGGPAQHVVHLAQGLDATGRFRTRLVAGSVSETEGDMAWYARERGVDVTFLPELSRAPRPAADLRALAALVRLFRRERPAVVHTHTAKAGTLGRLAAILAGVPVRIHTFHGHVLGGDYFSSRVTRAYLEVERQLARGTSRLVVLTEAQRREMAETLRVAPPERFAVVPLGLELEPYAAMDRAAAREATRRDLGIGPDEAVVGIVGRLVPIKRHELLLDALAALNGRPGAPAARCLVVGAGERQADLQAYAASRGLGDAVRWLGWRSDLPPLYAAMDVLALTSRDEGTPVAVLEALAAGTSVVARAVGGVPEVLRGGCLGTLVDADDPAGFAAALARTLPTPVGEGRGPVPDGAVRRSVADRYSVSRLVGDVAALYAAELRRAGVA